jgi:putative methyltransferase (TIGR04325 family)
VSYFKSIAKDWLPPAIFRALKHSRFGSIRFLGDYEKWDDAAAHCIGYYAESILAKVIEATLKVKRGEVAYERDSVVFDSIEYTWPVTAGLLWAAAQSEGRLKVLDFGGALGSSYFQNCSFFEDLPHISWSVIEQEHYVQAGQLYVQDETLKFYSSIDSCLNENKPNVALFSSVLQYLKNPEIIIDEIINSDISIIVIDRTPFSSMMQNRICIQNVHKSIYKASYPINIFSYDRFIEKFVGWRIVARNKSPEGSLKTKSGIVINFEGFILKRNNVK